MHGIILILHMKEFYDIYKEGKDSKTIIPGFFFIFEFSCKTMYFSCHSKLKKEVTLKTDEINNCSKTFGRDISIIEL